MPAPPIPITSGMQWVARAVIVDHDTGVEHEVGVDSATVTVDRKSDARRVVDATITSDVDPRLLTAPHRLKLWSGYRFAGVDYLAPLAHVRIGKRRRAPFGLWELRQCMSFESLAITAGFWWPYQVAAGASMIGTMSNLITQGVPWASVRVETDRDGTMPAKDFERERWQAIAGREESIATALGVDVGCDGAGEFVIRDFPAGAPTWDATNLVVDWDEEYDSSSVRNVWWAYSDHPDTPPARSVAIDTDPFSPTRIDRWGQAVDYYSSPLLTNQDMCQKAADTRLLNTRGEVVSLDFQTVPNPWADITDLVGATKDGVSSVYQLDRIVHRLEHDQSMQVHSSGPEGERQCGLKMQ